MFEQRRRDGHQMPGRRALPRTIASGPTTSHCERTFSPGVGASKDPPELRAFAGGVPAFEAAVKLLIPGFLGWLAKSGNLSIHRLSRVPVRRRLSNSKIVPHPFPAPCFSPRTARLGSSCPPANYVADMCVHQSFCA